MKLSEAAKSYVFETKIELDDENFIKLREHTMAEVQRFSNKDEDKVFDGMEKVFSSCIIDSSYTDDDGNPATGEAISKMLESTGILKTQILEAWVKSIPFRLRPQKNEK